MKRKERERLDRIRMEIATAMAAGALNVSIEDIVGDARAMRAVLARQVSMYIAAVGFGMSYGRVASAAMRDRSTVAYAIRAVEDRREDQAFDEWLDALERAAASAPVLA